MEEDVEKIIEELQNGNYTVSFEEPNNVEKCTKYDGSTFYKLIDDDAKFGVDGGRCIVEVSGRKYCCNLGSGDWEDEDGEYLDLDEDLQEALEEAEGVLSGEQLEPDQQWEVYCRATGTDPDLPYYWCEDEECPADINDLSGYDVDVPCQYGIIMAHGASSEPVDFECTLDSGELYELYKYLTKDGYDFSDEDEEAEIHDDVLEKEFPEIYESVMGQVEEDAEDQGYEGDDLRFTLFINRELLESALGNNSGED